MTQKDYIKELTEKICVEGNDSIDVMQYVRLLLAYNRRMLDKTARAEFDIKVEDIYPDLLCKSNKAKAMKDSATVSSLSSELVDLCEPEIKELFKASNTYEKAIFEVHNFVKDIEFALIKDSTKTDRKMIYNISSIMSENSSMGNDYRYKLTSVNDLNEIIYVQKPYTGKQLEAVEAAVSHETLDFTKTENKYFAGIVDELIKEDIIKIYSDRYGEKNKI
jgi:hypothetical protein